MYVITGASHVVKTCYPKPYAANIEVYEALGVQSMIKTQPGRKQNGDAAENKGASAASVDRQGH